MHESTLYAFRLREGGTQMYLLWDGKGPPIGSITPHYVESLRVSSVVGLVGYRRFLFWGRFVPEWVRVKILRDGRDTSITGFVRAVELMPEEGYEKLRAELTNLPQRKDWPQ